MPLIIRPFEPSRDWAEAIRLRNALVPEHLISIEEAIQWEEVTAEKNSKERYMCECEGRVVGTSLLGRPIHCTIPNRDRIFIEPELGPQQGSVASALLDHALLRTEARGATSVEAFAKTMLPELIDLLIAAGFKEAQRNPVSRLRLDELEDIEAEMPPGVSILSREELVERDDQWREKYYRLWVAILRDVPQPTPTRDMSFEEFLEVLSGPIFEHERVFFAVLEGQPIALTELHISGVVPERAATGLTGVLAPYRRRGIALALKLHAARWARGAGLAEIWTDNEEDNPMLKLNQRLGFRRQFDMVALDRG